LEEDDALDPKVPDPLSEHLKHCLAHQAYSVALGRCSKGRIPISLDTRSVKGPFSPARRVGMVQSVDERRRDTVRRPGMNFGL
jgi:hypothetical protein